MTTVPLDRQFFSWREGRTAFSLFKRRFARESGALDWGELIQHRRVIILAEAGSGKTEEMQEQARQQSATGKFAVFAALEMVANLGLAGSLPQADQQRLVAWQRSGHNGWFFIDSVDEAKLRGLSLERALARLSEAITGAERRAYIIVTCRLTDWEPEADLDRLNKWIPVPAEVVLPPTAEDEVRRVLRHEKPTEPPPPESPFIVIMEPLDEERIRAFAVARGIKDADRMLREIDDQNLWRFAGRPMDLGWLVDYWNEHNQFGPLAHMLETSLHERARETNRTYARQDSLSEDAAFEAVQRIGAGLILCRRTTVSIPDSEMKTTEDVPLELKELFPDWKPAQHEQLLRRPLFDPATFGRARLHNDNEGVVQSYLMAKWLLRLRARNLPICRLHDLLFTTTYGIDLVRPAMAQVTAWLALWDSDVAKKVARRAPELLLMAGDPANLPLATREEVLELVVERVADGSPQPSVGDGDSIRRFSLQDMAPCIRRLWDKFDAIQKCRLLLLSLIRHGRVTACSDIALNAAMGSADENRAYTQSYGITALAVTGSHEQKTAFTEHFLASNPTFSNSVIIEAIDDFFPDFIRVQDFLDILGRIDVTDADGGLSIEWKIGEWIERLKDPTSLTKVLTGLLDQLGPEHTDPGHIPTKYEEIYVNGIATAAGQLLKLSPPTEAPVAAIEATLRIELLHRHGSHSTQNLPNVSARLFETPQRRRAAFWHAHALRNRHPFLQNRVIEYPWEIQIFGYRLGLLPEDIDWLLADGLARGEESERRLAVRTAVTVARTADPTDDLMNKVEAAVAADSVMSDAFKAMIIPPEPSAQELEFERQAEIQRRNRTQAEEEQARSWLEFLDNLRADPDQLQRAPMLTPDTVDRRLFSLWQLLSNYAGSNSHYAIPSVDPLLPMLGETVAASFSRALKLYWRQRQPRLKTTRGPEERNQIANVDCMGITGVSIEAADDTDWAVKLMPSEAHLAAQYGTLEINGFPAWYRGLAAKRPDEVREVLIGELTTELDDPEDRIRFDILSDIVMAGPEVGRLVAPYLLQRLQARSEFQFKVLASMLEILSRGLVDGRAKLLALALDRFGSTSDAEIAGLYLRAAFTIDDLVASEALSARLDRLGEADQTTLALAILPGLVGTALSGRDLPPPPLSFEVLRRLVLIAFRTIRVADDNQRASGAVFSPDARDNAEQARSQIFGQLRAVPGQATYAALLALKDDPDCPIPASSLDEFAKQRALADSDLEPWSPSDVITFEEEFDVTPRSSSAMQACALGRLADIQHDLTEGDFNQGPTVKALPDEPAVQNWIAHALRAAQKGAYTTDRETHVADENEPDIRLTAAATGARLAIEIKIVENWTMLELEEALRDQLCGKYLRVNNARHGILLLVHQKARTHGWEDPDTGAMLDLLAVVARLKRMATAIASTAPSAPQPRIFLIDVSRCKPRRRAGRARA